MGLTNLTLLLTSNPVASDLAPVIVMPQSCANLTLTKFPCNGNVGWNVYKEFAVNTSLIQMVPVVIIIITLILNHNAITLTAFHW